MSRLGLTWLAVYLVYIAVLELRLLKGSCTGCYYYGKFCAFGRGRLSCFLFKKGDTQKFSQKYVAWKDIIPDFLVSIVPFVVGIVLLVRSFSWPLLAMVVLLLLLTSAGNGFVRGSLACINCRQRVLGCPTEQMFSKKKRW